MQDMFSQPMETSPAAGGGNVLLVLLLFMIQAGLLALVIVLVVVNRKHIGKYLKTGIVIGIVTFVLSLPAELLALLTLDMGKILERVSLPMVERDTFGPGFASALSALVVFIGIIMLLLFAARQIVNYMAAATEWEKLKSEPFPVLTNAPHKGWGRIGIAALVGVAAGIASMIFVRLLDVQGTEVVDQQREFFSGLEAVPLPVKFLFTLFFVWQAAITEEVLFRGALLGFLFRISKNRAAYLLGSIFLVSLAWAVLHAFSTGSPAFKISQIFILGCVFAEFARRWSLESAIAAHFTLNTTAVVLAFFPLF